MKVIQNSYPVIREAKVVNTTDPEKLGRIQLRVYPELSEISPESGLPWCFPHTGGAHGKSFGVPLAGQLITCVVWNKYWNEITFLPFNITKPAEHLFDDWKKNQKPKITDMKDDPEEEHFVVDGYEDGFTAFHDTKNSQHGFSHPKGTFVTVNKDGDIFMRSIKKITFHNEGSDLMFEADSESGDVTFKTKGKTVLAVEKDSVKTIGGSQTEEAAGDAAFDYKADWKITIAGDAGITASGNTKIESSGAMNIKSSGPCAVESSAVTTVKGSSVVVVDAPMLNFKGNKSMGSVPPSGSGVLCAVQVCPPCGIPHAG
jgi:hypothetical protein